jgi:hypothetical protein
MTLDVLAEPDRLSALLARSRRNVERSRWFVATAEGLVRRTLRLRRPTFAGGSDSLEAEPPRAESLRALRTRQKVARGALPLHASGRRWVGPGRGGRCDGCGDDVTLLDAEVEVGFRDTLILRLPRECFTAWESFERESRSRR